MKKRVIFYLILFVLMPFISSDIVSVNSGGSNNIVINSGGDIEGFFACFPKTCSQLGHNCDSWSDQCGGTVDCGSCGAGYSCSSGVCTVIPVSPPPIGGGGGGGGGAITTTPNYLKAIPDGFNIAMNADTQNPAKIDLINTGNLQLNVNIRLTAKLKEIVLIEEESLSLEAGELKTLNFQVKAPSEAGIYTGIIIFTSNKNSIEVPFILNVQSGITLFDISLDIPEKNRIIKTGDELNGQISLIQMGIQQDMDVSMHYVVKDLEDNFYLEESETIMINKQKNYEHKFNTQNLAPGKYIIGAEIIYTGGVATASYPFEVVERKFSMINLVYILLMIVLASIMIVLMIIIRYYKKKRVHRKK